MSKSIIIATPRVMAWTKLAIALIAVPAIAALYAISVYLLILIGSHWTPPITPFYNAFWTVSIVCWLIIALLFSRRHRTLRGGL